MTKEEIIEAIANDKMMPFIQPEQLAGIVDFVIKNYKPSLPSNLNEAAKESANRFYPQDCFDTQAVRELGIGCYVDGFKAAAELMAEQGFTMGATFRIFDDENPFVNFEDHKGSKEQSMKLFKDGDKIIVQIRKA